MKAFENNQIEQNFEYTNGLTWKTKRRYSYDRSTTKQVITFISQLF